MDREEEAHAAPDTAAPARQRNTGNRELNKQEKLARIRAAARTTFLAMGFDRATVREIAASADVALGTLFRYAKDKQDLLLLIFEEDLPRLRAEAQVLSSTGSFVDQLMTFFRSIYAYFGETPQLSRDMLKEITFGRGIVARRMAKDIEDTEFEVARIVARAQAAGLVSSDVAPNLAAQIIFSLHRVEIRRCLNQETPDIDASLDRLRQQIEVLFRGLARRESV